jgi:hypothetical protein
MWKNRSYGKPSWVRYCIVFGIGLALSWFCPPGFVMFVLAVLLVAVGIALLRRC